LVRAFAFLARRPTGTIGGALCLAMLLAAAAGLIHTPYDPISIDYLRQLGAPSAQHWLGTDEWGRDVLSRLLGGAATSVTVAGATALLATGAGTLLGASAGYLGGWYGRIVLAVMDALLAFPSLILALCVVAVFDAGAFAVVVALGLAYLPSVFRVVRASVLAIRGRDYVAASMLMGNGGGYTMRRHILPNVLGPVIVLATSLFGWALLAESALSFLGVGVPPPAPSWGGMLSDSRLYFDEAPWLALAPGIALSASLLGINLVGDALRDHFDPRTRDR
jgi:peptide/nickel transport system permease protein